MKILHNPRCSKSRQTLKLLQDQGIEPAVRLYLSDPPSPDEINAVLGQLGMEPRALMRRKEAAFKELGLKDDGMTTETLVNAMSEHPVLIERPIVITGDRAALGRPPENILGLL